MGECGTGPDRPGPAANRVAVVNPRAFCPECGAGVSTVRVESCGAYAEPCGHPVDVTITADNLVIEAKTYPN